MEAEVKTYLDKSNSIRFKQVPISYGMDARRLIPV